LFALFVLASGVISNAKALGNSIWKCRPSGLAAWMSFSYGPPKDKKEMTDLLRAAAERALGRLS
jgi:hypothetical protein